VTDLRKLHADAIDRACDVEAVELVQMLRDDYAGLMDGDEMDLMDTLHEVLDSHNWVFLTGQAEAIRYGSRFSEAYFEQIGEQPPTVEACAYMALQTHVLESDEWGELFEDCRTKAEKGASE